MRGPLLLVLVALAACGGAPRPRETSDLLPLLESPDPSERAWAVSELLLRRPPEGLTGIVARLRDEDGGIRMMAFGGLKDWTGEDHGYRPFEPAAEREAAVRRWESWLATRDGGTP